MWGVHSDGFGIDGDCFAQGYWTLMVNARIGACAAGYWTVSQIDLITCSARCRLGYRSLWVKTKKIVIIMRLGKWPVTPMAYDRATNWCFFEGQLLTQTADRSKDSAR